MKWIGIVVVALMLMSCGSSDTMKKIPTLSNTDWLVTSLGAMNVSDLPLDKRPTLSFNEEDYTVSGFSGCNNYNGGFNVSPQAETLTFGLLAVTKKMCPDMKVEKAFMNVLEKASTFEIEGNTLRMFGSDGVELMEAAAGKMHTIETE